MPVPAARLIYHPRRQRRTFGSAAVYFDSTTGNQDPYVWKRFSVDAEKRHNIDDNVIHELA